MYIFFSEIDMNMNQGEINVSNAMRQIEIGGWRGFAWLINPCRPVVCGLRKSSLHQDGESHEGSN
jgi:hypothetical protein